MSEGSTLVGAGVEILDVARAGRTLARIAHQKIEKAALEDPGAPRPGLRRAPGTKGL